MGYKNINGHRYYYRMFREGGRVRSERVRGELGEIFAQLAGYRALLDHADRAKRAAGLAELEARDGAIAAACGRAELVARLALERSGYHRPGRGRWRRKRRMGATAEDGVITLNRPRGLDAAGIARFDDLVDRLPAVVGAAQGGERSALPDLQEMFDLAARAGPAGGLAGLIELCGGELSEFVERYVINAAAGKDLAQREAIRRRLDRMRDELAGPCPSPLERMLVARVVLAWADAHACDLGEFRDKSEAAGKARDRASKRFLAAVKTLAAVRKLALPDLQVNIAQQQQVNNR